MNCIYKLFRLSLLLLFGMAAITDAAAQRYVADQLFNDSISVREVKIAKGDTITLDERISIPNGQFRILFDQSVVYAGTPSW